LGNWTEALYLAQDAGLVACAGSTYAMYLLVRQIIERKIYNPTIFSTFFSPMITIFIYLTIHGSEVDQKSYSELFRIIFLCLLFSISLASIYLILGYKVNIEKAMHLNEYFYGKYIFRFIAGSMFFYALAIFIIFMLYYVPLDCDTSKCNTQRILLGDGYFIPKAYIGLMMISGNSVWIYFCFAFAERKSKHRR
jgi:hypothetical protein